MEESARRLLNASDVESIASGLSGRSEIPYILQIPQPRLPEPHEHEILVSVCHVESPNHFWCHRLDDTSKQHYTHIDKIIKKNMEQWDLSMPIRKGNLVMGPYSVDGYSPPQYFRAKVISTQLDAPKSDRRVRLYFIDFGNATECLVRDLRIIPDILLDFPPLAIECHLTGVGPSFINDPRGGWTRTAKEWFESRAVDQTLKAKVRSDFSFQLYKGNQFLS